MPDSSARTVVVTGAASGIGRACALRFAGAGDTVVVADMNEEQGLAAVAEIAGAGGRAAFRPLDVADRADVAAAAAAIEAEHGPVSVLVNSAGILQPIARLADFPDETHDKVWQVNYFGTYNCCKAFGLRMADRRAGAIVNIASMSSYRTMPLLAYGPGKTAIVSLTGTLAVELGVKGVRVNAVAPGNVLTPRVFAERATAIATDAGLGVEVLDESRITELKMGLLLGVARGSQEPPRLVVLRHEPPTGDMGASGAGDASQPVLGLIGKGVTFDTGGISIKPADNMDKMKDDMSGAAAVLCAVAAISALRYVAESLEAT